MSDGFAGAAPPPAGGDYHSWNNAPLGATLEGTIVRMYSEAPPFQDWGDKGECPHLDLALADGTTKTLRCSQTAMWRLVLDRKDELAVGHYVKFTLSGQSGNAKLFSMEVTPAATAAAPAPQAPAAPAVAPPPAPAAPAEGQPPPV